MRLLGFIYSLLLLAPNPGWAWTTSKAKIGVYETTPYQSSNPKVFLKDTAPHNQAQSEECYLFAFVTSLDVANQNGWNRRNVMGISSEILFMQKMEEWAREVWTNQTGLDRGFYFDRGGDVHHAMRISVERGLYPSSIFRPLIPFTDWDFQGLYKDIRAITREEKIKIARAQNQEQFNFLFSNAMNRLRDRLGQEGQFLPPQFTVGNQTYTPQKFENQVGVKRNSSIHYMYPQGRWDMGDPWDLRRALLEMVSAFNGQFRHGQTSWKRIWHYVIESLDKGMPTMFSLKWAGVYHVLVATGYEYDAEGRLVTLKMKNTWGPDFGDQGSAVFSPQELQKSSSGVWGFIAPASF